MGLIACSMIAVVAVAIGGGIWGSIEEGSVAQQQGMSGIPWEEITNKTHDCWTWIWNRDAQIGYCEGQSKSQYANDKFFVYADYSRQVWNKRYSKSIDKYSFVDSIKYDQANHKIELNLNGGGQKIIRITRKQQRDKAGEMKRIWDQKMQKRGCQLWAKSSDEFIGFCNQNQNKKKQRGKEVKQFWLYAEFNENFSQGKSDDKVLKFYEVDVAGESFVEGKHEITISLKDGRVKKITREKEKSGLEHVIKEEMTLEWGPKDRVGAAVKTLSGADEVKSDSCSQSSGTLGRIGVIKCKSSGQRAVELPMRRTDWAFVGKRN